MKIIKFKEKEEWLKSRIGRIGGTRKIMPKRGTSKLAGFWELIAERVAVESDDENPMERGVRLEGEALELFAKETKKKVENELITWEREDNGSIYISPDGTISDKEAVEVKCVASAKHIEAFMTQKVPSDYEHQMLQYFVVNDLLETLYFVFYDPRIPNKSFFYLTVNRKDVEARVEEYLQYQKNTLEEVDEIVLKLSDF